MLTDDAISGDKNVVKIEAEKILKYKDLRRDEITGTWRRPHNEVCDLYSSPNIIRAIKSSRKRWAGIVARMEDSRCEYQVLIGKHGGKENTCKT